MRAFIVATALLCGVAFVAAGNTDTEVEHPTLPGIGHNCLPTYDPLHKGSTRRWFHRKRVTGFEGKCVAESACPAANTEHGYCAGMGVVCCRSAPSVASSVLRASNSPDCAAAGGVCGDPALCKGTTKKGLCSGGGNNVCCVASLPPAPATPIGQLNSIVDAAAGCTNRRWLDRGAAPKAFIRGIAQTYAKTVCTPNRADVVFMGTNALGNNDALNWYGSILKSKLGVSGTPNGAQAVRALYTLMLGLGMRESSGRYCVGRDMSASFSSSTTAEAGLFQTSYGAHVRSKLLDNLFNAYRSSSAGCLSTTYTAGVSCGANDMKNWGGVTEMGYIWQKTSKDCPAFATEYAAVLLRLNGGSQGEWGPLRRKEAEVVKECYDMLGSVANLVATNPAVCAAL